MIERPVARLRTVATFQKGYFLENLSNGYTTHASGLFRIDLMRWQPGQPVVPELILTFPAAVRALNGCCLIGPKTMLVADCFASLVWRVDLSDDGHRAIASVWLKHYSMLYHPGEMKPEQAGINGIHFAERSFYVYYTSPVLKLFMRVRVDPETLSPLGSPEYVGGGQMMDDFCIDERRGIALVATHRQNTIDLISLQPRDNASRTSIAGDPFDQDLVGPSSGAWGRATGENGRVAFVTTDGGTTALPPDGILRPAKVLRVEL